MYSDMSIIDWTLTEPIYEANTAAHEIKEWHDMVADEEVND